MSVSPGERYGRSFSLGGPVSLWATRNATLSPNVVLTPAPVSQSPVASFSVYSWLVVKLATWSFPV